MYLIQLEKSKRNGYISDLDYLILKKLYKSINEKTMSNTQYVTLYKMNKNIYDDLFKKYNTDIEIYEIADSKLYPKSFASKYSLLIENTECLLQTKSYDILQINSIKSILKI